MLPRIFVGFLIVAAAMSWMGSPSTAGEAESGETLFRIKCGRCHSALRMSGTFYDVKELDVTRKAFDARVQRHFLKDATERKLIIDYLIGLAAKDQ